MDEIYLQLLDKEGMYMELLQENEQLKEKVQEMTKETVEKEMQTTDEFKILFTPHNKDTGDTLSSVYCLDDTDQ